MKVQKFGCSSSLQSTFFTDSQQLRLRTDDSEQHEEQGTCPSCTWESIQIRNKNSAVPNKKGTGNVCSRLLQMIDYSVVTSALFSAFHKVSWHCRTEPIHHSIFLTLIHKASVLDKTSLLFFPSHWVSNYYLWMKCALAGRRKECHMRLDTITRHGISAVGR